MKDLSRFVTIAVLLTVVVAALPIVGAAQTATTDDAPFQLSYYNNRNNTMGADQFVDIVNDGANGSPISSNEGDICVNIYVFDSTQEMTECCSCKLSANGLLHLSILNDLTSNPLTGFPAANSGVIKLVSTSNAICSERGKLNVRNLQVGMLAWQSQVMQATFGNFTFGTTEFLRGTLSNSEASYLPSACGFVQQLGSGKGHCTCGGGGN